MDVLALSSSVLRSLLSSEASPAGSEYCLNKNVTYEHRVDNPTGWNWCLVPDGGYDAVLFGAIAIAVMCLASPRWDALVVLFFGGIYFTFSYYWNLEHVSNAVMLWLGMRPADIFVYVFLPPFLLDLSVRIDFFMLKKMAFNIAFMAFVMVAASALLLIPFMLYALDLKSSGWTAGHVALFGSMIASTDAASVSAVLRSGGGPEILSVLLEGESLFNDASSLTLFEIFKEIVTQDESSTLGQDLTNIVVKTIWSAFTGICIGLGMGIFTRWIYAWLQYRNMEAMAEVAWSVAGAYLSFYITQVWCKGSGCIGAVAFGLYGSATLLWGMSTKARLAGIFSQFWAVMTFVINGLIFFYVGASAVNFTIRSATTIFNDDHTEGADGVALVKILLYKLPLIFLASFALRFILIFFSFKLFQITRLSEGMSIQEVIFVTVGGLRGSLSLVLAQSAATLVSAHDTSADSTQDERVKAEIAIYTAGYVLLTLLINAPLCGPLLTLLGLDRVRQEQLAMRGEVKNLFRKFTATAIEDLAAGQDEDELLQGLDWAMLRQHTDFDKQLDKELPEVQPRVRWCHSVCTTYWRLVTAPVWLWRRLSERFETTSGDGLDGLETKAEVANRQRQEADLKRATNFNLRDLQRADSRAPTSGASGGGPTALIIRDHPAGFPSSGSGSRGVVSPAATSFGANSSSRRAPPAALSSGSVRCPNSRRVSSMVVSAPANGPAMYAADGALDRSVRRGGLAKADSGNDRSFRRGSSRFLEGAVAGPVGRVSREPPAAPNSATLAPPMEPPVRLLSGAEGGRLDSAAGEQSGGGGGLTGAEDVQLLPPPPARTAAPRGPSIAAAAANADNAAAGKGGDTEAGAGGSLDAALITLAAGDVSEVVNAPPPTGPDTEFQAAGAAAGDVFSRVTFAMSGDGLAKQSVPRSAPTSPAPGPASETIVDTTIEAAAALVSEAAEEAAAAAASAAAAEAAQEDAAAGLQPALTSPASSNWPHPLSPPARAPGSEGPSGPSSPLLHGNASMPRPSLLSRGAGGGGSMGHTGSLSRFHASASVGNLQDAAAVAAAAAAVAAANSKRARAASALAGPGGVEGGFASEPEAPSRGVGQFGSGGVADRGLLQSLLVIRPGVNAGRASILPSMGSGGHGPTASPNVRMVQRLGDDAGRGSALEALRTEGAPAGSRALGRSSVRTGGTVVPLPPQPPVFEFEGSSMTSMAAWAGDRPLSRSSRSVQDAGSRPLGRASGAISPNLRPAGSEVPTLGPFEFALPEDMVATHSVNDPFFASKEAAARGFDDGGGRGGGALTRHSVRAGDGGSGLARGSVRQSAAGEGGALGRASVRVGGAPADGVPGGGGGGNLGRASVRQGGPGLGGGALGRGSVRLGRQAGLSAASVQLARIYDYDFSTNPPPSVSPFATSTVGPGAGAGGATGAATGPVSGVTGEPSPVGGRHSGLTEPPALPHRLSAAGPGTGGPDTRTLASASRGGVFGAGANQHIMAQVQIIQQREREAAAAAAQKGGGGAGGGQGGQVPAPMSGSQGGGSSHHQYQLGSTSKGVLMSLIRRSVSHPANGGGQQQMVREASGRGVEGLARRTRFADSNTAAALARASVSGTLRQPSSADVEGGSMGVCAPLLVEYRLRLLAGLKQYYRQKHAAGSLSPSSYKVLNYVTDQSAHHPEHPLALWSMVKKEVSSGPLLQAEAAVYFFLKHWVAAAKNSANKAVRAVVPRLLVPFVWTLSGHISATTLSGLETAVELWASLTQSLQTEWLQYSGLYGELLLEEVQHDADGAWAYIIERRIEAPNKFGAVQTHRAVIDVLTQQQSFVREMNEGGMIDESECRKIVELVERRLQLLARRGPRWRQPTVMEILAGTAILRGLPPRVVEWIRKNSIMRVYQQGAAIWDMGRKREGAEPDGLIIVVRGVVRIMLHQEGALMPYYLGAGGVGGLVSCVLEAHVPGMSPAAAYAEGNAMGKGPVVMHVPWSVLQVLRRFSREEHLAPFQALELQLYRTAAVYVLDLLRHQVTQQFSAFIRTSLLTILSSERIDGPTVRRQRIRLLLQLAAADYHVDGGIDWIGELMDQDPEVARLLLDPSINSNNNPSASHHHHSHLHHNHHHHSQTHLNHLANRPHHSISSPAAISNGGGGANGFPPPSQTMTALNTGAAGTAALGGGGSASAGGAGVPGPSPQQVAQRLAAAPWVESMYKAVAAATGAVVDVIRSSLKDAILVVLSPGQGIIQRTTMVLIQGSLEPAPIADADGTGGAANTGGPFVASSNELHVAPSVMVWVSDYFEGELVAQREVEVVAGSRGATLLMWGALPEELLLPSRATTAAAAAAEAEAAAAAAAPPPLPAVPEGKPSAPPPTPASPARRSLSMSPPPGMAGAGMRAGAGGDWEVAGPGPRSAGQVLGHVLGPVLSKASRSMFGGGGGASVPTSADGRTRE